MSSALIIVDVQNDFLPGGALGVNDGNLIIDPLIAFGESDLVDHVVFTQDYHPVDHVGHRQAHEKGQAYATYEDGNWPVHCVAGTVGAEIDSDLLNAFPDAPVFQKGTDRDREAYSGFDGTLVDSPEISLAFWLGFQGVENVYIGGLALDYCVKATVLDAFSIMDTTLLVDATRPVSYLGGAHTMAELGRYVGNGLNVDDVTGILS
jgi:nicotinamidase/pyrazinamidase